MERMPQLREKYEELEGRPSDEWAAEVEDLTRNVPRLISVLAESLRERTDIRHRAALSQMITALSLELDQLRPLAVSLTVIVILLSMSHIPASSLQLGTQLRTACVPEQAKLHHIRATVYEKFLQTIQVA